MKKLVILFSVFLSLNAFGQAKTKVTVKFEGFKSGEDLYLKINDQEVNYKTEGKLLYEGELALTEPMRGTVTNFKRGRYTTFWIEPGHGEVTIYKKNFIYATTVKDSESHSIYLSLRTDKSLDKKRQLVYDHIDNPAIRYYLNHNFQFSDFTPDDLKKLYAAIAPHYLDEMEKLRAYVVTRDIPQVKRGTKIHDFIAQNADGDSFNTTDYRGKYLLLDFAATGCGPCWTGYPGMIKEVAKYENLQVLTLNDDHSIDAWKRIAKNKGIDIQWPVLWDSEKKREILEVYNISGWPTFFLISPKGEVLDTWSNASDARIRTTLKEHLK